MPCASYTDERLAAVYDTLNPWDRAFDFHVGLSGARPLTILDMGCGTGRVAIELARRGHRVWGADPAAAMLAIARKRPGGEGVTWVQSDAASLDIAVRFDLIIMTGHVFQVFLADGDVAAALRALRAHLAPGGRLAFETRNPIVAEWRDWVPEATRERITVPGLGTVDVHYDIASSEGEIVTFETHFRFGDGDVVVTASTLRFMDRDRLSAFLAEADFNDIDWYGDWDGSSHTPESPEIIVVAS